MHSKSVIMTVALAALLAAGCASAPSAQKRVGRDGVYVTVAMAHNGPMRVSTTITGGKIVEVRILEHGETPSIAEVAIERIPRQIIETQSTAVDTVSGATVVSDAILQAVNAALEQSRKAD
jgi:uncharacterized protein with FMN-binding domain